MYVGQRGLRLLVIGWRFSLALTSLAVAPFLWRWRSFHPLLLFFGRCVGILQGSIFWITCWDCSIRFPCTLEAHYSAQCRLQNCLPCDHRPLLKVIHFVVANDQTCGVSGRSIEDSVSLLRDVKHYASTGSVLDPIGLNPMDNRFGFEHRL